MRLYKGKVPAISREVIDSLMKGGSIEVLPENVGEAEADVASVLNEYLRMDREVSDAAKDFVAKKGLDHGQLSRVKRSIAKEKGFGVGDDALDYVLKQVTEILFYSKNIEEVFAEDHTLRKKVGDIINKHVDIDEELDKEVRKRVRNLEEGTEAFEIESDPRPRPDEAAARPGVIGGGRAAIAFTPVRGALALTLFAATAATVAAHPAHGAPPVHRAAAAPLRPFHAMGDAELAATLRRIHARNPSFGAKVAAISGRFLTTPYKFNPLGEGPGGAIDRDPTFSVQRVDCLTFIEEVLALAHAPDLEVHAEAPPAAHPLRGRQDRLRDAPPLRREPVAAGCPEARRGPRDHPGHRRRRGGRRDQAPAARDVHPRLGQVEGPARPAAPARRLHLAGAPHRRSPAAVEEVPAGAIVTVVRVDRPNVPTRITHQGIVVVKQGKRYLRHASGPPFKRVIDFSLDAYFRFCMRYFKSRWPVFGVNVQMLTESPALRVAADERADTN